MGRDHGYQLGERNIWCKETCFNLATHVLTGEQVAIKIVKLSDTLKDARHGETSINNLRAEHLAMAGLPLSEEQLGVLRQKGLRVLREALRVAHDECQQRISADVQPRIR